MRALLLACLLAGAAHADTKAPTKQAPPAQQKPADTKAPPPKAPPPKKAADTKPPPDPDVNPNGTMVNKAAKLKKKTTTDTRHETADSHRRPEEVGPRPVCCGTEDRRR